MNFPISSRLLSLAAACLLAAPALVQAETADRYKPLNVEADAMQYNDASKTTTFTGRVVATKGTIVLRAGTVRVQQDAQGNQLVTLLAGPGEQALLRQKRDGLNEFIEAQANQMVRDDRTLQTQLTGNARIRRLVGSSVADEVIGHRITYNELTETYSVTGGASTATGSANAVPSGRVRATIVPLNQSGSRR